MLMPGKEVISALKGINTIQVEKGCNNRAPGIKGNVLNILFLFDYHLNNILLYYSLFDYRLIMYS